MSQYLTCGVSDVHPMHLDSTEAADPLLGVMNHLLVRVIMQSTIVKKITPPTHKLTSLIERKFINFNEGLFREAQCGYTSLHEYVITIYRAELRLIPSLTPQK